MGPSALATALGISRQMVYQYEREGKISRKDGQFDLDQVRRQLVANLGTKQGGSPRRGKAVDEAQPAGRGRQVVVEPEPQPHGGWLKREHALEEDGIDAPPGSKADLEKRLLAERVEKAQLANKAQKKTLVDAGEASAAWSNMITTARNKALMLPSELAPGLALETDAITCEEILRTAMYALLSELSEWRPEGADSPAVELKNAA